MSAARLPVLLLCVDCFLCVKFTLLCFCRVFSQHIATGEFDPTREDWLYQLQQMPTPAHREADAEIRRHIRTLLPSIVQRDEERGFTSTLTEDEAVYQFNRCDGVKVEWTIE